VGFRTDVLVSALVLQILRRAFMYEGWSTLRLTLAFFAEAVVPTNVRECIIAPVDVVETRIRARGLPWLTSSART
jgi:hypothetical protein